MDAPGDKRAWRRVTTAYLRTTLRQLSAAAERGVTSRAGLMILGEARGVLQVQSSSALAVARHDSWRASDAVRAAGAHVRGERFASVYVHDNLKCRQCSCVLYMDIQDIGTTPHVLKCSYGNHIKSRTVVFGSLQQCSMYTARELLITPTHLHTAATPWKFPARSSPWPATTHWTPCTNDNHDGMASVIITTTTTFEPNATSLLITDALQNGQTETL